MMKKCKILGTAAAMMLVLALAGCENNTDDVDALKKRVDQMEQELADMEINNNLAESSQDKAAIHEVSASDDSIASLTQAVDDMVSKANEAKPDGTEEEKMEQFFTLKKEMKSIDSRLDAYEDYLEYQYRQEKLSREEYQSQDQALEELEDKLGYFDEMKDSLSQSVLIAQDTAERVKQAANERSENIVRQAEQDAQHLVDEAKQKANEILRHATDNAKKVAVETEELKNKTRVFHQRLKSTIESQLSIIDTPEWDEILRPTAMYIQTSDEAFREIVEKALGESVHHHHAEDDNIDLTRQFSPAEIEELQKRIEAANLELGATQAFEGLNEKVQSALEEAEHARHENEEVVAVEETVQPEDDANRESVNIL